MDIKRFIVLPFLVKFVVKIQKTAGKAFCIYFCAQNRNLSVLWCCSLRARHFCIPEIDVPNLGFFLIPLVESFVLKV